MRKYSESFRIMKTYLEARPVFLQRKESIYGHFTICYLALTLLRLLELKVFKNQLSVAKLVDFIRNYSITETPELNYINNASKSEVLNVIRKVYGLDCLDNAYLRKKEVDNILKSEFYLD